MDDDEDVTMVASGGGGGGGGDHDSYGNVIEAPPPPPPPGTPPASGRTGSAGTGTPPNFTSSHRVFFVCFHLPVTVVQNKSTGQWRASWSESILAKTEGHSQVLSSYETYWVGTVTTHPPLREEKDKQAVRDILEKMDCIPIFLDPAARQAHYYGFCKQVLWPAFHNIDLLDLSTSGWLSDPTNDAAANISSDWDQSRLHDWWQCYVQVNRDFCDLLSGMIRAQDIVWYVCALRKAISNVSSECFRIVVCHDVTIFYIHGISHIQVL